MIVLYIGIEELIQLLVRLLDLLLILAKLDVDLIDFVSHRLVLREDLVKLLLRVGEKSVEKAFVLTDLIDIKFGHDARECFQHSARIIQLGHIHAPKDYIRSL